MTRARIALAFLVAVGAVSSGMAQSPVRRVAAGPAWTRGGTCYEVFVRSFYDSNGDGIGDLNGLISKLDYINDGNPASTTSLGADCLWLMPIDASPSYHGYDVSDYYTVEPAYGTNADFKRLMVEAHRRGIKVLVDLVLNHTSREHPHFLAALQDTTSPYRKWYRFAPTPPGMGPWGAPAWRRSPVRDEYYYGAFDTNMPDLDYHNPAVRAEAIRIATFWLRDMGVDGFRLDAVPYLVEDGDCLMHCPGTHAFLHTFASAVRRVKPDAFTIGEAWGDITTQMSYYPDQLDSYFIYEISDSLLSAVRSGIGTGVLPPYLRMQDSLPSWRYSPFLTTHDYTRTMTALRDDRVGAGLAATMLLTLPGLPFVYYGDEIGMTGDKPDPQLRTPMQWTDGRTGGFTTDTPWEPLHADVAQVNVASQDGKAGSLLTLYRQLIHLRRDNPALAGGSLIPLNAGDPHVVAYLRRTSATAVLVVLNLGAGAAADLSITSPEGALSAGDYAAHGLLGALDGAALRVRSDGRLRGYDPLPRALGPREALVLELRRTPR